jgi:hypothetical protein
MHKGTDLTQNSQIPLSLFPVQKKSISLNFEGEDVSSNGGLLLLRETAQRTGLLKNLAACITDNRDQRYVTHSLETCLAQRIYQICAGYEDANDSDTLKNDPILKLCAGLLPQSDSSLASQPTISRMENSVSRTDLYRMAVMFVNQFINSYTKEPEIIILDCDDTNYNAHGAQQGSLFNTYYGESCFMPLHIYEGISGKLITTILKPGRRSKSADVFAILRRLITYLRKHWRNTLIVVRGDAHFASPALMEFAGKDNKLRFITGLTANSILNSQCADILERAKRSYLKYNKPIKVYHSFMYQAASWKLPERVVAKIEVNQHGTNLRFVVTNLCEYRAKNIYEVAYCARGRMELFIKEHKTYLKSDRISCNKFTANQFRVFLHSAAYVLFHALRTEMLRDTEFERSSIKTLQLSLIKVAAYVKELKTKIIIELPRLCPAKMVLEKVYTMFMFIPG